MATTKTTEGNTRRNRHAQEGRGDRTGDAPVSDSLAAFREAVAEAKGVRSATGKSVKLGRARTRVAGSRGFLCCLARGLPFVSVKQIYEADDELHVLNSWKSVGDALCGDPEGSPTARGLGMARKPGGRELVGNRTNAQLAVSCLLDASLSPEEIAALAGKDSPAVFLAWLASLPA